MMAGTEASGLVQFCVDSFGSSKEMSKGQVEAALHIPQEDNIEEEEDDVEQSAATSDPVTAKQPDICSLAKLAYPTDSNSLSVTRVSPELYSAHGTLSPVDLLLSIQGPLYGLCSSEGLYCHSYLP